MSYEEHFSRIDSARRSKASAREIRDFNERQNAFELTKSSNKKRLEQERLEEEYSQMKKVPNTKRSKDSFHSAVGSTDEMPVKRTPDQFYKEQIDYQSATKSKINSKRKEIEKQESSSLKKKPGINKVSKSFFPPMEPTPRSPKLN